MDYIANLCSGRFVSYGLLIVKIIKARISEEWILFPNVTLQCHTCCCVVAGSHLLCPEVAVSDVLISQIDQYG